MYFDDLFPDVRENFEPGMRQCQMVMLRMLKIVDHLCAKHNISYFLNGGTLLGAIRHKGFIPWDDDLDIGMTRANYEKFVKLAVPELPYDIFFQSDETDKHFPACHIIEAKLRDKYSSYQRRDEDKNAWLRWQDGLQIDIAVFDRAYLPHNFFIYLQNRALVFFCQKRGNKARAKVQKSIRKYFPFPLRQFFVRFVFRRHATFLLAIHIAAEMTHPAAAIAVIFPAQQLLLLRLMSGQLKTIYHYVMIVPACPGKMKDRRT